MIFELNFKSLISSILIVSGRIYALDEQTTQKSSLPKLPTLSGSKNSNFSNFLPRNVDITKCLQKSNSLLCNEAGDYPWKKVQKILSSKVLPSEYFGNDSIPVSVPELDDHTKNHEPLDKHAGNDDPLDDDYDRENQRGFCESRQEIKFPKVALNKNLELRYILQGDSTKYQHGILTESCVSNAECMFSANIPPEISVRCVEKYLYKKLIALNPSNGDPYVDEFPIPACCVCMFKVNKDD